MSVGTRRGARNQGRGPAARRGCVVVSVTDDEKPGKGKRQGLRESRPSGPAWRRTAGAAQKRGAAKSPPAPTSCPKRGREKSPSRGEGGGRAPGRPAESRVRAASRPCGTHDSRVGVPLAWAPSARGPREIDSRCVLGQPPALLGLALSGKRPLRMRVARPAASKGPARLPVAVEGFHHARCGVRGRENRSGECVCLGSGGFAAAK